MILQGVDMQRILAATFLAAMMYVLAGSSVQAQGDLCDRLWIERNAIYKENGYCFKTARAIRYFGNAGCVYDRERDVPLSRSERNQVARIHREERRLGCRD
jgi:hypothetical protein